jgi:hypothetical protein
MKRTIRILAECEVREGRDIYTRAGFYLGQAESKEQAELWAASGRLARLCKRAADGDTPSKEEFAAALAGLLAA